MRSSLLLRNSFQWLVALTALAMALLGGLHFWQQAEPANTASVLMRPDNAAALAIFAIGLMLRLEGQLTLCRGIMALLLAFAGYHLGHNFLANEGFLAGESFLAGENYLGSSWFTGYQRLPSGLALLIILVAVGMLATTTEARGMRLAKGIGYVLMIAGGLHVLYHVLDAWRWMPVSLSGLSIYSYQQATVMAGVFAVLAGMVLWVNPQGGHAMFKRMGRFTLSVGVMGVVLACSGWFLLAQQNLTTLDQHGKTLLHQFESNIAQTLQERLALLQRQAERWQVPPYLPNDRLWQRETESYLRDYPELASLWLFDENRRLLRHAMQSAQTSTQGAMPVLNRAMLDWQHQLMPSSTIQVSSITQAEGRPVVWLTFPLVVEDNHTAWLRAELDVSALLNRSAFQVTDDTSMQVHAEDQLLFSSRPLADPQQWYPLVAQKAVLPHVGSWQMSSYLDTRELKRLGMLPTLLWLTVLVFTFLLMGSQQLHHLSVRSGQRLSVKHDDLQETLKVLRILERGVNASINGVMVADAKQTDYPVIYVNKAFERITGYPSEEVLGRNCRFLQGPDTEASAVHAVREALHDQYEVQVVLLNYRKDGTSFWNELFISPVLNEEGAVTHFVSIQHDISAQREYEAQLAFNASHDALTGLPNRSLFEDRLKQASRIAGRYEHKLAVLFLDLDGFKPINDNLGHQLGDQVLNEVTQRITDALRPGETVARFGGDEFVILLPELAYEEDVISVVEQLLVSIALPYRIDESDIRLTASIGLTIADGLLENPLEMIQQADLAMCQAKRQGRNTYQWFTCDLNTQESQRVVLRNELQTAIEKQQFELFYQPQVHAFSGQVIGFEALIRWKHPQRGYISPVEFIGLAEDTGQIIAISDWVLATACRDNVRLNSMQIGAFTMAVNISPMQFQRGNFIRSVRESLERTGLPANLLELELTEGILMENAEHAIDALHKLRREGIRIAIDDFGTGFSSLSYLKRLPIDKIKIDRSFVNDVISDQRDAAIIQGILSMAYHLQLGVVAEGIETQGQYAYLRKHGCNWLQGYYFARPMPLATLEIYLEEQHQAYQLNLARQRSDETEQTLMRGHEADT
ncbi:EAL domain-containing protein [Vreelandella rituensis]|nr:EAL domain-containing protein [Halomonas rituensis]